jgi:ATP-dependent Clp protease adaptor protein ClpS
MVLASSPVIVERPRLDGPGSGTGDVSRVVVLNDSHNTFDGVATVLAAYIPGVDFAAGMQLANQIHSSGQAIVWRGAREVAELYWEQLADAGLTMAPLD